MRTNSLVSTLLGLTLVGAALVDGEVPLASIKHPAGSFVTVNGVKLWTEAEGQGTPLLLIAGGPGSSHVYFHPFLSSLATRNRVIYFDAFGRGKSARAKDKAEYTFAHDVDEVEGLRKALGIAKWNVLGHSYGGVVAQEYALKYPGSIAKLVLADTFYSGEMWQANNDSANYEMRNQLPEAWEKVMALRRQGMHSSAKEHQKAYDIPSGLLYNADASNSKKMAVNDTNDEVYYTIAGDDADFLIGGDIAKLDFRTRLKELKMPVLVTAGRYDRVSIPRFAVEFKRFLPSAQFVMFENSGHSPFLEEPEKWTQTLLDFLGKR